MNVATLDKRAPLVPVALESEISSELVPEGRVVRPPMRSASMRPSRSSVNQAMRTAGEVLVRLLPNFLFSWFR